MRYTLQDNRLLLTPDEKKTLAKLPKEKYDFIIRCVKSVLAQQLAFDMKVWKDGRIVFTPKKFNNEKNVYQAQN